MEPPEQEVPEYNPQAIVAVCCGILGLFLLQVVLAPLTIVLSAIAYHSTEGDPWSRRLTYVGYTLGILDGIVWLVLESVFDVRLFPL
ncbi:MAG TPA: hypothetical protein VJ831_14745 [Jatrophihabitantaceae bacterium]|nr:hypothetical protein [Jatrophihabitantaceae bacterium]